MDLKRRSLRTAAVLIAAVLLIPQYVMAAPSVSANSAVLMDGKTGRVLWSKNPESKSLIASTTKIMTGLLIAEDCTLSDPVEIPKEAVGIEGSSLYLREGEVLTVEALLYGMMLHSGNDAAAALALYHSGSVDAFADAMNRKAEELSLSATHFANPHGLDSDENYSTALDLAKLAKYAMDDSVFRQVVSTKVISIGERSLTNHNKLLWRYDGVIGVKTGYTQAAGRILVSCAERDGRRLIAVTISAPDDWNDHRQMLDHGFSMFENKTLIQAGQIMGQVPVISGGEETAHAVTAAEFACMVSRDEEVTFRLDLPEFVFAPLLAGEQAGMLYVCIDGQAIYELPLYWRYSVLESG